jgi:hypothetical protein
LDGVLERRMQVIDGLGEASPRLFVSLLIEDEDLNVPGFHGKSLLNGRLVAINNVSMLPHFATGK